MAGTRRKQYFFYKERRIMEGPFDLDPKGIALVPRNAFGVYVLLDDAAESEKLITVYVGRGDIRARLLGHFRTKKAGYFAYVEVGSAKDAFFLECKLFHKYGKRRHLDNEIHPATPARSRLPVCSELGCNGEPD